MQTRCWSAQTPNKRLTQHAHIQTWRWSLRIRASGHPATRARGSRPTSTTSAGRPAPRLRGAPPLPACLPACLLPRACLPHAPAQRQTGLMPHAPSPSPRPRPSPMASPSAARRRTAAPPLIQGPLTQRRPRKEGLLQSAARRLRRSGAGSALGLSARPSACPRHAICDTPSGPIRRTQRPAIPHPH